MHKTKQKLIDAAREEFLLNGYDKTDVRSIAKKAGKSYTVLYTYFKNKEDLFDCVIGEISKSPAIAELKPFEFAMYVEKTLSEKKELIKKLSTLDSEILSGLL